MPQFSNEVQHASDITAPSTLRARTVTSGERIETRRAAQQFDAMERELDTVEALLREPSLRTLQNARAQVKDLSLAFRAQKRVSTAFEETRTRLSAKLQKANARLDELEALFEPDMLVDGHVHYNCGKSL